MRIGWNSNDVGMVNTHCKFICAKTTLYNLIFFVIQTIILPC